MKKVLLTGATGYLGGYILSELLERQYEVSAVVRSPSKLDPEEAAGIEVIEAQVTEPESITGCCDDVDCVISTVGITDQKDDLTYMDVDYGANKNLLDQALQSGVEKFIYTSVLNGKELKELKVCEAKELFVDELKRSGLDHCVVRPNGFFSDMEEIFNMARKGRIFLFGDGEYRLNPIHGEDLAPVFVDAVEGSAEEIEVGGPEILSHREIAGLAFEAAGEEKKITCIPEWLTKISLFLLRTFTSQKFYGPKEFFLTVLTRDMVAPRTGEHTLEEFYKSISSGD